MKNLGIVVCATLMASAALLVPAAPAQALDGDAVGEILEVLRNRGLLDQREYERLVSKHEMQQGRELADVAADQKGGLLSGFDWSGDLRLRYEGARFERNPGGAKPDARNRFRYRLRFGFTKSINDWLTVGVRLASGDCVGGDGPGGCEGGTPRSTSRSFGTGEDFDLDPLWIDRAYASIRLPEGPADLRNTLVAGKMSNPFHWREMPDLVVWDGDIAVEGFVLKTGFSPAEGTQFFSRVGYLVSDQNSGIHDPHMAAVQLGGTTSPSDALRLGLRGSGYFWHSLNSTFRDRAESFGNLPGAFDDGAEIGELVGFVKFVPVPEWPVKLYGMYAKNFSARSRLVQPPTPDGGTPPALAPGGKDDTAWGAGVEFGSAKEIVKLGVGYYKAEANSVIASMTDSNLFDGETNRRGWVFTGSRNLSDAVAVKASLYKSKWIDDSAAYFNSFNDADRYRFQTDLVIQY